MKHRRNKSRNPNLGRPEPAVQSSEVTPVEAPPQPVVEPGVGSVGECAPGKGYWLLAGAVVVATGAWLFGNTLRDLAQTWDREPDYSHGFLVAPFAALMLWMRRGSIPKRLILPGWGGLFLIGLSFALRYLGERFFITSVAGWALVLWVGGVFWLLAGWQGFKWALPAIVFLFFMIPLPLKFEQLLSWHLQGVATRLSTVMLQCLGQPAIAERHTIFLGDHRLEIEQACSGLRMCVGIAAVAFAFVVLNPGSWWERIALALGVVPVAVLSNAIRIVVTGLLMQFVSGEAAAKFSHDAAGWAMIGVSAVLFWLFVLYLQRLIVLVEVETGRDVLRSAATA